MLPIGEGLHQLSVGMGVLELSGEDKPAWPPRRRLSIPAGSVITTVLKPLPVGNMTPISEPIAQHSISLAFFKLPLGPGWTRKLSPRSLNADAAEVSTVIESANKNTSQKKNSTTSKTRGSLNKTIEKFKDDVRHRKSTLGNKDLLEGEGNDEDQGRRLKNAYNRARRLRMKQGEASRGRHKPLS
ncbi:hypothetical protein H0E87_027731 [Populus deltoides]|uniref:Uncharacterized protein n=1 Tax=Populus deltoides TaxID=3696 RepID=A0A8T2WP45_POPDE|nr:hypothetical protein H0E87_027731 [Populus deltoides]